MGWSGFDGQKYHMRQKPRKAFKNVKHYQDISTNKEAKLVVRENMHNSFWNLLKHAITVKNTIWTLIISLLIGIFTICIVPAFLASIFRSKDTTYIENQAKIESDKHAYHVLMAGASRNFSNGYYEYSKSDILRAHKIYPNRLAPMYMLAVIYSEDCVKKNYNCDKYQSFKTVVLSRTKDDKDWKEQRLFLLKEYDEI